MTKTNILNGDALVESNKIPNESIDLILTDPPYNISGKGPSDVDWCDPETGENLNRIHSHNFSKDFDHDWDKIEHTEFLEQIDQWSQMWFDKLRPGGAFVIFISDCYLSFLWRSLENVGLEPKRVWTWKKPAAVPFNRRFNPISGCEYAIWGIRPKGKRTFNVDCVPGSIVERYALADKISSILYKHIKDSDANTSLDLIFSEAKKEAEKVMNNRRMTDNLIECVIPNTISYSGGGDRIHPTQKPTEILEYFIELLTKQGDTVLDTFAGSGSTAIAAQNRHRNFIVIERDEGMFLKMKERIEKNQFNEDLFTFDY